MLTISTSGTGGDAWITTCKLMRIQDDLVLHHFLGREALDGKRRSNWESVVSTILRLSQNVVDIIFCEERDEKHPRVYSHSSTEKDEIPIEVEFFPDVLCKMTKYVSEERGAQSDYIPPGEYAVVVVNSGAVYGYGRTAKRMLISELMKCVQRADSPVIFLGTDKFYDQLPDKPESGIRNLVGKTTLLEAMLITANASNFIGPLGLLSFVALAHRVPSTIYNYDGDRHGVKVRIAGTPWEQYVSQYVWCGETPEKFLVCPTRRS
jgi:hypothetical protein